jgi:DNA polymerase I-like protein with 3'-5' exonuclease and polymerase domains
MAEDDFDPHILMALTAGMITEQEFKDFKAGNPSANAKLARKAGKTTNYAAVYNSGAETLSRSSGMSVKEAKDLLEAYWKLNWSVKTIAEDQCVFTCDKGKKWLVNPVNGFCYSLRKDSDRFSTLCQGTGSFFFDMWVDKVLEEMQHKFGVKRLSGCFHDEFILCFKDSDSNKEEMKRITEESIENVSNEYLVRRELGCTVQFGNKYSEIH